MYLVSIDSSVVEQLPASWLAGWLSPKVKARHLMEEQWALGLVVGMIVLLFVSSTRTDLANIGHHRSQVSEHTSSKTD